MGGNQGEAGATVVVDYGLGNLLSLSRALEKTGHQWEISSNPDTIRTATRLIIPGVGSFAQASRVLHDGGFTSAIWEAAQTGTRIMGICLGMQILFDEGFEHGSTPGLGLIRGSVEKIPIKPDENLRRTHTGWRTLTLRGHGGEQNRALPFDSGPYYFVHSFMVNPYDQSTVAATTSYGSTEIPAVVAFGNIVGVQFHPEKSGIAGLKVLEKFL